jgi:glutamate formiminotransferase
MPLVTIPNVSEGRDTAVLTMLTSALGDAGCRVLDVHSDARHNRSVFTAVGQLVGGLGALAEIAVETIDLRAHTGVHPRVGVLDVCPVVPHEAPMDDAVRAARDAGAEIAERASVPVYFYGDAAHEPRSLPEIRAGGLETLIERARLGFSPDLGPHDIDPRTGVVCVGARGVLVAFNVWLRAEVEVARAIASVVRARDGGLPGVRALGLDLGEGLSQVSMNLTAPDVTGIDAAFAAVASEAARAGAAVEHTEVVGLVPERYLPNPNAEAARLLVEPGRSLESALTS